MLSAALLAITCAGLAYLTLAVIRTLAFTRRSFSTIDDEFAPSITVLKPIAGAERDLYEHLASFCAQDYPDFEVVFCLRENDPALETVDRVCRDFPDVRTRVAVGHNDAMANPKIANLAKRGADPNGEIVIIADSDVLVTPRYLRAIAAEFATESTGATTCLYGGVPNDTWVSDLGTLHLEDEFLPSVLVALALGPLRFCLGATVAVRRDLLERIGGLEALGPYLADDHALGELVTKHGRNVTLCRYTVKTSVPETHFRDLWSHELRWARTKRAQAPAGYAFSFVMYALPFSVLFLLVAPELAVVHAIGLRGGAALVPACRIAPRAAQRTSYAWMAAAGSRLNESCNLAMQPLRPNRQMARRPFDRGARRYASITAIFVEDAAGVICPERVEIGILSQRGFEQPPALLAVSGCHRDGSGVILHEGIGRSQTHRAYREAIRPRRLACRFKHPRHRVVGVDFVAAPHEVGASKAQSVVQMRAPLRVVHCQQAVVDTLYVIQAPLGVDERIGLGCARSVAQRALRVGFVSQRLRKRIELGATCRRRESIAPSSVRPMPLRSHQ